MWSVHEKTTALARFILILFLLAVWTTGLSACGGAGGEPERSTGGDVSVLSPTASTAQAVATETTGNAIEATPAATTPPPAGSADDKDGTASSVEPLASTAGLPEGFLPELRIEVPVAETENRFQKTDEVYFRDGDSWPEAVELNRIESKLWMHVSYSEQADRLGASNGLVLFQERSALLVNTPGNAAQTRRLLNLIRSQFGVEVTAAVLTSAESACAGGVGTLQLRRVPVYALANVAASLPDAVRPGVHILPDMAIRLAHGDRELVLIQPGADGGPQDSLLWLPQDRALYSRSLILPESTPLPDASQTDLLWAWRDFLDRWLVSHDDTDFFIPGDGEWGTRSMIDLLMARITEKLPDTMTQSAIELFRTATGDDSGTTSSGKAAP